MITNLRFFLTLFVVFVAAPFPGSAAARDIKIGLAIEATGTFASLGEELERGFTIHMEDVKWSVGGNKIVLVKEDTQGNPNMGLTKVTKLVELDKVDLVTGVVSSAIGTAIKGYIHANKVPLVLMISSVDEITIKERSPYIYRIVESNVQQIYPYGQWLSRKRGFKRAIVIASDYAAGRSQAKAFMAGFRDAGGAIVQEIYTPLTTQDYAPFLATIKPESADLVYAFTPGATQISLFKQFEEYGLKGKIPMAGGSGQPDMLLLQKIGKPAVGTIVVDFYSAGFQSPQNAHYLARYKAKHGGIPSEWAYLGYAAGLAITDAIRKAGADTGREALAKALAKVDVVGPRGRLEFDANGQMIGQIFLSEVVQSNEGLTKKLLDTVTDLRQIPNYERVYGKQ